MKAFTPADDVLAVAVAAAVQLIIVPKCSYLQFRLILFSFLAVHGLTLTFRKGLKLDWTVAGRGTFDRNTQLP